MKKIIDFNLSKLGRKTLNDVSNNNCIKCKFRYQRIDNLPCSECFLSNKFQPQNIILF